VSFNLLTYVMFALYIYIYIPFFLTCIFHRFPWKLHIMLDAMSKIEGDNKAIVCWQPHGKAFMVHKPKDFVAEVMPHFFNQTKYASFQRQLNLYGFSRLTHGPDKGSYFHRCFIRGRRHLCKGMVRQKIKGTKVRKSLSPEDEPDFYAEEHNRDLDRLFVNDIVEYPSSLHRSSANDDSDNLLPEGLKSMKKSIPIATKSLSNSIASLTSEATGILTFDTSNEQIPSHFLQENFASRIPRVVSPRNSTNIYNDSMNVHQAISIPVIPATGIVKGGDLLFFEGQPFRYLEHFEEVPRKSENDSIQPTIINKLDNADSSGQNKLSVVPEPKIINYSSTQMIYNATSTDKFQDMISNIMYNIDSSASCSQTFRNDLKLQNTSCIA